ncbi:MAG: phosphate acyltransferase PlsX [Thermaerobacter sp.]|jgi:glycerol-3-phosphate acyltransferase PlsX|nr:phosphate acyltransferase PlsX [Thermaerobacter sp.]MDA8145856.1 phosphate acyltransferase PlsX [Thermaerobacter sp.]
MKIAVDAMGGDYAPAEVVRGALEGARAWQVDVVLVGNAELVRREAGDAAEVVDAPEVIAPEEPPAQAIRRKRRSSLAVGLRLLKEGRVDALVSAGSTGAMLAGGVLMVGGIPGVRRPALGTTLPTAEGWGTFLLDMGANVDVSPQELLQYGIMGSLYVERVLGVAQPRVAILNVGTEPNKGNEMCKAAHVLLASSHLNFVGNLEARDLPYGRADVVVCDGFVGNVVLKLMEGVGQAVFHLMRREIRGPRAVLGGALLRPELVGLKRRLDYAEYGGAPLLGLARPVIKCHGSSRALAIRNGVRVARDYVVNQVAEQIRSEVIQREGAAGER